jgi:hypothetical protein
LLHMSNMVACFGWNRPSWGNTKHKKFLEVLTLILLTWSIG